MVLNHPPPNRIRYDSWIGCERGNNRRQHQPPRLRPLRHARRLRPHLLTLAGEVRIYRTLLKTSSFDRVLGGGDKLASAIPLSVCSGFAANRCSFLHGVTLTRRGVNCQTGSDGRCKILERKAKGLALETGTPYRSTSYRRFCEFDSQALPPLTISQINRLGAFSSLSGLFRVVL
jgi:hypothetical protein